MGFINTLLHHPLHPMVVHFPIALTASALFFIFLALIGRPAPKNNSKQWLEPVFNLLASLFKNAKTLEQIAFANISLAAVSTIVAGIAGIYDNIHRYGGTAANHQYKIILASFLLVITTGTALLRWRKPDLFENKSTRWVYAGAYLVSFGIAAVLGFLGALIVGY